MRDEKPNPTDHKSLDSDPAQIVASTADQKPESRLDRLRQKIKALQGKDPDIYPMF